MKNMTRYLFVPSFVHNLLVLIISDSNPTINSVESLIETTEAKMPLGGIGFCQNHCAVLKSVNNN